MQGLFRAPADRVVVQLDFGLPIVRGGRKRRFLIKLHCFFSSREAEKPLPHLAERSFRVFSASVYTTPERHPHWHAWDTA